MSSSRRHAITFGWPYESVGGSQIYLLNIASRLGDTFDVSAVMPERASPALFAAWRETGAGVTLIPASFDDRPHIPLAERPARRLRKQQTEAALRRAIAAMPPSPRVLHLDLAPWSSAGVLDALSQKASVVVTLHTRMPSVPAWREAVWRRRLQAFADRPSCRLVAASRHVRESLTPYLTPSQIEAVPIAYSTVDMDLADRVVGRPRQTGSRPEPGLEILTVGQFIDRKGPWVLLEAARQVLDVAPDTRFTWIAPEPLSAGQQRRVTAAGLGRSFVVDLPPASDRPRDALFDRMAQADIFLLPSLEDGLPLALVEAMALGLPSVASDLNGIPEAIDDGVEGRLVPPGDVEAVARALGQLAGDEALRRKMGRAALTRARRQFSSAATADVMVGIYRELVEAAGPSGGSGQ